MLSLIPQKDNRILVKATQYVFDLSPSEMVVRLQISGTQQRYVFFSGGACNADGQRDETISLGVPTVKKETEQVTITFTEHSSLWESKSHYYILRDASIQYSYVVHGHGALDRCFFFRGFVEGRERGMSCDIEEIYSTAPNFQQKRFFHPGESFSISAGDALEMPVGGQALASPHYCLGLRNREEDTFLSLGVADYPGHYTWDRLEWNPDATVLPTPFVGDGRVGGGIAVVYDGKEIVKGKWNSPQVVITLAQGIDDVLRKYLAYCVKEGFLPQASKRPKVPLWWKEPIYCTWHDQNGVAASLVGNDITQIGPKSFEFCSQEKCDHWIKLLEQNHCKPGTVILDATWAVNLNSGKPDPVKWPDMRAWVDSCHARGIRVFIWALAWATEGLPTDECMTRDDVPVAGDITNPKFLERFRETIRTWFSAESGCLNADGIKLDGQLNLPTGRGLVNHGSIWGLELQRLYLKELYTEAKKYKPDVCISTFSLNTYLADYTDMVRLADLYTPRPTALQAMKERAALYRIALPHALIDTDGSLHFSIWEEYAEEFREQAELGIPTLYNAEWSYRTHFFQPTRLEKLSSADYQTFSEVFSKYRDRHQLN